MKECNENTLSVRKFAIESGADLVGIADLRRLESLPAFPKDILKTFRYGISLAISLDRFDNYGNKTEDKAFALLENLAIKLSDFIEKRGYSARIAAPNKRISKERGSLYWFGEIPHKAVAKIAGLGWIGKSLLLVTPQFGPRVSLITVITDMPLKAGSPLKNNCGKCKKCIEACPANALTEVKFEDYPERMEVILDVEKCNK